MADWSVGFQVTDGENNVSIIRIALDGSVTIADIDDWVPLMRSILQDIVDGDIRVVTLSRVFAVFTAGTPDPDSDVEIKGKFIFQPLGTIKRMLLSVPTFKRSLIVSASKLVDLADVAIAAFVDAMVDGITVNTHLIRPRDSENRTLDGIIEAHEDYGKLRR